MASARAQPGSGSILRVVKEAARHSYGGDVLLPDLGGVRFAIVGGLATACYMPQRMTVDTDILVEDSDLAAAETHLRSCGCEKLGDLTVGGSAWRMPGGRTLDVLALSREWVPEALNTVDTNAGYPPFIALPYLVLMKLESGRLQDLADISRMLGFADADQIDETRHLVSRYRPEDSEDLESMIHLGKLEHGRQP